MSVLAKLESLIPKEFRDNRSMYMAEHRSDPDNSEWTILYGYLRSTVDRLWESDPEAFDEWKTEFKDRSALLCSICGKKGHIAKNCFRKGMGTTRANAGQLVVKDQALFDRLKTKYGGCKFCRAPVHTFPSTKSNDKGAPIPSDRLSSCDSFKRMEKPKQVEWIVTNDSCLVCLSWNHVKDNCQARYQTCNMKEAGTDCGLRHHRLLHGVKHTQMSHARVQHMVHTKYHVYQGPTFAEFEPEVFLGMVEHNVLGRRVVIFTDDGSNASMITHDLARKLMLDGAPMDQMMEVLGQEPDHHRTKLYKLDLVIE